jgi:predicted GNAT superfamily acetyltransferase
MYLIKEGKISDVLKVNEQIPEFSVHFSKEHFENKLHGLDGTILLAYLENEPVGFSICFLDLINKWGECWVVGVIPEHRKKGVCTKLFDAQEDWVRKQGFTKIRLDVNQSRLQMLLMHLNRGYIITGINFDTKDHPGKLFMEKDL